MKNNRSTLQKLRFFWKDYFPGLVPLFVLAHFFHHVPGFIIQPLLPAIRDTLDVDYFRISWLVGAYSLAYGISNLPAGWLGGRVAPRTLITLGIAGVAGAGLLVGIAPNYWILVIAMLLMGVLGGGYHPMASPLLADTIHQGKKGRALGVHQIGGTLANIVVPLITAAFIVLFAWREMFFLLCAPTLVYGLGLYLVLKKKNIGNTPQKTDATGFVVRINPRGYFRRLLAFVTLGTMVQVFVFSTLSFVTLLTVDHLNAPPWLGMLLLSLGHIAGLIAGPIGGSLSDRIGKVPVMLVVSLCAGPFIYMLSLANQWWLLPFVLLGLGSCMYVAMPVSESFVISTVSHRHRSTVLGFYYFASRGGPGILIPIIGRLVDQYGFSMAFSSIGMTLFIIAFLCSMLLWGTKD